MPELGTSRGISVVHCIPFTTWAERECVREGEMEREREGRSERDRERVCVRERERRGERVCEREGERERVEILTTACPSPPANVNLLTFDTCELVDFRCRKENAGFSVNRRVRSEGI